MKNNWIKDTLESASRRAIPVMTHPGIEALGFRVIDALKDGEVHYKAIKHLADRYPAAACCTIMDLTVEAEAFGCKIEFQEDDMPHLMGRLVSDAATVSSLTVPGLKAARVPQYLKAASLAAQNITDRPVFAGCIGPFSLAGRLYDMSEIMVAIYTEPDVINELLEKCTAFISSYCKALKELGTDGVFIAEPAAGLLSDEDCMAFSSQFVQRIVKELQDENFSVILHNCGNTGQCTHAMIESGAAALHFGNSIDMVQTLNECPRNIPVMGNIDPVSIMKQASPQEVKEKVLKLLRQTAGYKNFVLSTGCDVPPRVPAKNISAFFEALQEYNGSVHI